MSNKPKQPLMGPLDPTDPNSELVPYVRAERGWNKGKWREHPARPMRQPEAGWNRGIKGSTRAHNQHHLWQYNNEKYMDENGKLQNPGNKVVPAHEIAGRMMKQELNRHIRRASEELINQHKEQWLAELHEAAAVILQKARDERDQNALMAVWDRVIGKPTTQVDMSVRQEDTIDDIASQLQAMTQPVEIPTQQLTGETNGKENN
jgi:hypothetical protein